MARGQRGPRQQEGGAEAAYVRFLDCHPKLGYEGPVTSRDQRPPEQRVFTMWWRGAYAVYFDHSLETYLLSGTAAHDVHISMDAARIVLGDADRRLIVM